MNETSELTISPEEVSRSEVGQAIYTTIENIMSDKFIKGKYKKALRMVNQNNWEPAVGILNEEYYKAAKELMNLPSKLDTSSLREQSPDYVNKLQYHVILRNLMSPFVSEQLLEVDLSNIQTNLPTHAIKTRLIANIGSEGNMIPESPREQLRMLDTLRLKS
jgi:hypothetical protein